MSLISAVDIPENCGIYFRRNSTLWRIMPQNPPEGVKIPRETVITPYRIELGKLITPYAVQYDLRPRILRDLGETWETVDHLWKDVEESRPIDYTKIDDAEEQLQHSNTSGQIWALLSNITHRTFPAGSIGSIFFLFNGSWTNPIEPPANETSANKSCSEAAAVYDLMAMQHIIERVLDSHSNYTEANKLKVVFVEPGKHEHDREIVTYLEKRIKTKRGDCLETRWQDATDVFKSLGGLVGLSSWPTSGRTKTNPGALVVSFRGTNPTRQILADIHQDYVQQIQKAKAESEEKNKSQPNQKDEDKKVCPVDGSNVVAIICTPATTFPRFGPVPHPPIDAQADENQFDLLMTGDWPTTRTCDYLSEKNFRVSPVIPLTSKGLLPPLDLFLLKGDNGIVENKNFVESRPTID
jgi:hypothetical protein